MQSPCTETFDWFSSIIITLKCVHHKSCGSYKGIMWMDTKIKGGVVGRGGGGGGGCMHIFPV